MPDAILVSEFTPLTNQVPLASYQSITLFPVPPLTDKTIDPFVEFVQHEFITPFPDINEGVVIVVDA